MCELGTEYIGQKYLPIAETIGDLKKQIADLPDNMDFGFLNQPRQQLAIREYNDGYKCAVFNGRDSHCQNADFIPDYARDKRV